MRDAQALARQIYELAGAEPAYPPLATTLAEMVLGPGGLRMAKPGTLPADVPSRLVRLPFPRPRGGVWPGSANYRIEVRRRLFDGERLPQLLSLVAHEIGEWGATVLERYTGDDIEDYADESGLLIRAPRAAVRRLCADAGGPDYEAVAEDLIITEIEAAVRVAEALDLPTIVFCNNFCWEAGPLYNWPGDYDLLAHLLLAGLVPRHVERVEIKGGVVLRAPLDR